MKKIFRHTFKDGQTIELTWDLSKAQPYCEANLKMDNQPLEIIEEYRIWQNQVVVPEIFESASPQQLLNFVRYGHMILTGL